MIQIPDVTHSSYTTSPTSHTFSDNASSYMSPYLTETFDNGFETDDEIEGKA